MIDCSHRQLVRNRFEGGRRAVGVKASEAEAEGGLELRVVGWQGVGVGVEGCGLRV